MAEVETATCPTLDRERWVFVGRGPHGVLTWQLSHCPTGSQYANVRDVTVAMHPERFWIVTPNPATLEQAPDTSQCGAEYRGTLPGGDVIDTCRRDDTHDTHEGEALRWCSVATHV